MTGKKQNNKQLRKQSGQVLLITIMLLATALTVALSVSFKSTTETQITKLEEESQKALAAAEAGIEAALKANIGEDVEIGNLPGLGSYSGIARCENTLPPGYPTTKFVSPLTQKDGQYTFYLNNQSFDDPNPYNGDLTFYYASETGTSCSDVSLELTLIADDKIEKRWIADTTGGTDDIGNRSGTSIQIGSTNNVFNCGTDQISLSSYSNPQLLIIRTFTPTKLGFVGTEDLKIQGKYCPADVTANNTGVSTSVYLFQSFSQIPADFFITSF